MDFWEVQVRLIDNGYDTILDTDGCQVGDLTTFQSVAVPELSELIRTLIKWFIKKIYLIAGNLSKNIW